MSLNLVLIGLGVAATLYALHHLALWAERRGWLYYRHKSGSSGSMSNAFLEVQSLLEPSRRYVLEEKRRDESEEDDSGEPPTT